MTLSVLARPSSRASAEALERHVAVILAFMLPITAVGARNISLGVALAIGLGAVITRVVIRYPGAVLTCAIWLAALPLAWGLAHFTLSQGGRAYDGSAARLLYGQMVVGLITFLTLLWTRSVAGLRLAVGAYAAGVIVQGLLERSLWADNPMKYVFLWPLAVLLLATTRWKRPWLPLLALAGAGVYFDFRSFAGLCALAMLLTIWRHRRRDSQIQRPTLALAVLSMIVWIGVQVGTLALAHGYLGAGFQVRTEAQLQTGHSLLVGARPEWGAAIALAKERPLGFGPGIVPSASDAGTARSGLASLDANTDSAYVNGYLLGDRIELHSVMSDLWLHFGFLGAALAAILLVRIARGLAEELEQGAARGLLLFLGIVGIWDLAFSPMGSNFMRVIVAAVALWPVVNSAAPEEPQVAGSTMAPGM